MAIPVYRATITENDEGIFAVSLVDEPAVEIDFLHFAKDKKPEKAEFKFEVEEPTQHMITGVLMVADVPIYRWSEQTGEYYIVYEKETVKKMAEKMLKDGTFRTIDIQHDEYYFWDKVNLVETYIKDTSKGIAPAAFSDVPDGSLFVTYRVTDIDLWEKIEKGELRGFSLEGYFGIEEKLSKTENQDEAEILSLIEQIKNKISK